ncbi:MAG: alpha/beta hydrolase, partial [Myxococcales bacterium]|nr:alpha/beta hydrolase [Myxococcales bacterium]
MPIHNFSPLHGRIVEIRVESRALAGNLLGDPHERTVAVYLPPGYDDTKDAYPLLVDLAGFTGSGLRRLGWTAFGESVPQRLDRLIASGAMGPVVVAFPDAFTALGGNQYIDSLAMGGWESFLIEAMLPRLEREFRLRGGRDHRGVYGKSSGGYGALVHGMRHADVWGAIASHSGDVGFDLLFRGDFPKVLDALAPFAGSVEAFIASVRAGKKIRGDHFHVLMVLAMAATYDPDPSAFWGIRLPVDPHTCELDEVAWARWLAHDPLRMIDEPACQAALRSLRGLYIDVGSRDQYMIHYGTRALVRRLEAA